MTRSLDLVRDAGGPELVERLLHLDQARARASVPIRGPSLPILQEEATTDYDVVFAGGGLSLLIAACLADLGVRVAVFERSRAGQSHREWNASKSELQALVRGGICTAQELEELVLATYDYGTCLFHEGSSWPVYGVLDHAVDAGLLLSKVRRLCEKRGVHFFDHSTVLGQSIGPSYLSIDIRSVNGKAEKVFTKYLVDARGASSPYADSDLVCPTVGGVICGLDEGSGPNKINPKVGEILATTEGVDARRQHVWEAFPGRPGETTVYLFHYAKRGQEGSLVNLYARFFETLPRYKTGGARLLRPTFGYIPGWSRLTAPPKSPSNRILLVGDAAARHSPLTFCGFGAMLRSFQPAAQFISSVVNRVAPVPDCIVHDTKLHSGTGPLAALIASGTIHGNGINKLLDAAFGVLHSMGNVAYAALLKDQMQGKDFVRFVHGTSRRVPAVYRYVFQGLGLVPTAKWGLSLAQSL